LQTGECYHDSLILTLTPCAGISFSRHFSIFSLFQIVKEHYLKSDSKVSFEIVDDNVFYLSGTFNPCCGHEMAVSQVILADVAQIFLGNIADWLFAC
jgi:hypothetical protein